MMNYDNHHSNNNLLFLLPADIIINILSRLPVESVLQCKHVCKTWQTLINDPVFVHIHSDRLLLHDNISFGFLLCTYKYGNVEYHFGEYSIHGSSCPTTTGGAFRLKKPINHEPFPLVLDDDDRYYKQQPQLLLNPVDSCNGLICLVSTLRDGYNMCVYNPLTREYVNLLPRFSIIINNNNNNDDDGTIPSGFVSTLMVSSIATGFGYHPGTKEYKIVRIYYENMYCSGQVSVYTLGSGRGWRSKGETSHLLYGTGVFANGALHWLTNSSMIVGIEKYIVSFDMVDEEFRIIPSPPPNIHHIELGVLEGCLSATGINSYSPQNSSDVWVMSMMTTKKHDQEEEYSWSKKYNIPWSKSRLTPYNPPLAPLLKDNKILLHYGWMEIVSYDTKRGCLDDNILHTTELVDTYKLIPYRKSITSLKALGEDGARIGKTATQQQLIGHTLFINSDLYLSLLLAL